MKFKRFDQNEVKAGDPLVLARFNEVKLSFRFMGHDGDVVAVWIYPDEPWRAKGVILRQRDVLMVVES